METSKYAKLFGKYPTTSKTIFHEIAEAGALQLLYRIRDTVEEPVAHFLQEKDSTGDLCVHVVVKRHRGAHAIQLLKVLVELGADLNALNDVTKFTILHLTVVSGDYDLAYWLAQHPQVDLNIKGWDGLTAYEMAFIETDSRMMEILRAYGARGPYPDLEYDWIPFVNREE
ncbi:vankyrin-b17 [Ichnoviriform fugitivi]|uniref:Vankyrin-b17 n=1 Tax=Ichnoviriform fugitivi TaxID=265522 RepID=Q6PUP5_9VIRU|nr:vankyrin-b17 [Ichnoviriform fugitivi]AAS90270.1 vankyrin-b17 [Ichnoviriform fugitivi]